jgi:hypothetical protein
LGGLTQECADRYQAKRLALSHFGSSKVPRPTARTPGSASIVQKTWVLHFGQNSKRSQRWLSSERCS